MALGAQKKVKSGSAFNLPEFTMVEVVAIKGDKVRKKQMTLYKYRSLRKIKGWIYRTYQIGFCSLVKNTPWR